MIQVFGLCIKRMELPIPEIREGSGKSRFRWKRRSLAWFFEERPTSICLGGWTRGLEWSVRALPLGSGQRHGPGVSFGDLLVCKLKITGCVYIGHEGGKIRGAPFLEVCQRMGTSRQGWRGPAREVG